SLRCACAMTDDAPETATENIMTQDSDGAGIGPGWRDCEDIVRGVGVVWPLARGCGWGQSRSRGGAGQCDWQPAALAGDGMGHRMARAAAAD
ncbi:hypothetical protein T310_8806, partial [Rasamsonia emersonii CBS 393.64]